MHPHSIFTATQILWTLTFAAQLVLLVVLLGRDRAGRFPWFTFNIALAALGLLGSRLLTDRLAPLLLNEIFITLAVLTAVVSLLVLVELARRAFAGASRRAWVAWVLVILLVAAALMWVWGPWPAWKMLTANSTIARLRLMQFGAEKGSMLADMLAIELGLLVAFAGRRFHAGWRSHAQRILIGLSTVAISQLAIQGVWQVIALHVQPHSQAEYERVIGLGSKLVNANKAVYVLALVWWIACLWKDEPGATVEIPVTDGPATEVPAEEIAESPAGEPSAG